MSNRFYLETSVIRSYLIGHSAIKELLKQKLKNQIRITSNFVKMEFNRSLIQDLVEFYFVLSKSTTISDAIKYWNEDFHSRKIKNVGTSIIDVFTGVSDKDISLGLLKLRNSIKILIIEFKFLVNRYDQNNSNCYLSNFNFNFKSFNTDIEVEKEFSNFLIFFKENCINKCNIVNLINNSSDNFEKILKFNSKKVNFKTQQENIIKVLKLKSNKKMSCNSCKIIGDTIIAFECPTYSILLTLDKIYEDLCPLLNLNFELIPSIRSLKPLNN